MGYSNLTDLSRCRTLEDKFYRAFKRDLNNYTDEGYFDYTKFLGLLERAYGFEITNEYGPDEFIERKFGGQVAQLIKDLLGKRWWY